MQAWEAPFSFLRNVDYYSRLISGNVTAPTILTFDRPEKKALYPLYQVV